MPEVENIDVSPSRSYVDWFVPSDVTLDTTEGGYNKMLNDFDNNHVINSITPWEMTGELSKSSELGKLLMDCSTKLYLNIDKVDVLPDNIRDARAVEMTMGNGDKFRAECCKGDEFDLETGISICITKAIIAAFIGKETCTREYNRLIRQAVKVYKQGIKDKATAEEEKKRIENRKKKAALKKQRRKERKQKEQAEIFANAWSMFYEKVAQDMMNEYMTEEPNEEN